MSKINFYPLLKTAKTINPNYDKHGISVPFRMLIAAPSGAGKTNMLMNLLVAMNKTFHEIILCIKSADEPLYEHAIKKLGDSVVLYEDGNVPDITEFSFLDEKTNKLKRKDDYQRLMVFDDLILEHAANMKAKQYYVKGRHLCISSVYIGQSFYQIPKMIRTNCQLFILGRGLLKRDLKMIMTTFPTDLTLDQMSKLYNDVVSEPMDTILINIDKRIARKNITGDPIQL